MRVVLAFLVFISVGSAAQTPLDSLHRVLKGHSDDSFKVDILNRIAFLNLAHSLDTMELYAKQAIALGEKLHYMRGVAEGHKNLGAAYYSQGSYRAGLEELFKALKISEQLGDKRNMARALHNIGATYFYEEDYVRSVEFTSRASELFKSIGDKDGESTSHLSLCECYLKLKDGDRAISFCQQALRYFESTDNPERMAHAHLYLGGIYELKGQPQLALQSYWRASRLVEAGAFRSVGVYLYHDLGRFYLNEKKYDSASFYLYKSRVQCEQYDSKDALMLVYQSLSELHERRKHYDSALYYNRVYVEATRRDFNLHKNDQIASMEAHYNLELKSQELLLNQQILKSQRTMIIFIGVILVIMIVSSIVIFSLYLRYRSANKKLKELNAFIQEKNEEILAQAEELQSVNSAMKLVNSDLEARVEERTHEVKLRNQQLIEYAYFNAHKVRGPLARILGLVNVIEIADANQEMKFLSDKIRESAEELDEVVREINKKLDTD